MRAHGAQREREREGVERQNKIVIGEAVDNGYVCIRTKTDYIEI